MNPDSEYILKMCLAVLILIIRCCNCISWTPGHSRLFGRCTAHKTTCYINGSCPDWIWDATA